MEEKKILLNVLTWFKLRCYTLIWEIIKTLHVHFMNVNIALNLYTFLWSKLEFYARVNEKDVSFVAL